MPPGLDDRSYRRRTAALRAKGNPCWLCGAAIDYSLPYTHAMSFTADHIEPRSTGGKLLGELRAAHRSCNSRRGNKPIIDKPPQTNRGW